MKRNFRRGNAESPENAHEKTEMNAQSATSYLVATGGDAFLVLIRGRANYMTCRAFGEFLETAPETGRRTLILDMKDCVSLDSTVLGLIAGAAEDFRKIGGELCIQNASGRVRDVIVNLGLPELLTLLPEGETVPVADALINAEMEAKGLAPAATGAILHAHETLMAANPENVARFKDVVAFMRDDLKK